MAAERELTVVERIGSHSHIKGLGVSMETLEVLPDESVGDGIVGQRAARKAAAVVLRLITENKISGRALVIHGAKGTGKTALAKGTAGSVISVAMSLSLGTNIPFVAVSAGEFFSASRSKAEAITQMVRRAVGVEIIEKSEAIEGEVVELVIDSRPEPYSSGKLTLKTTDMEAVYDLGYKVTSALIRERVAAGDIICIDKALNRVTKKGRSVSFAKNFDASGDQLPFLPCPEGELQRSVSASNFVTLHDIDVVNSNAGGAASIFSGDFGEVRAELRGQVDDRIGTWVKDGKAKVKTGVLFIDEIYMMDVECYSCLNRYLENDFSPLVILTSNRPFGKVRGTSVESPFGIPADFLERSICISTGPYSIDELARIIRLRAIEESVQAEDAAVDYLASLAAESSLRYSLQLLAASDVVRSRQGAKGALLTRDHIAYAMRLFGKAAC